MSQRVSICQADSTPCSGAISVSILVLLLLLLSTSMLRGILTLFVFCPSSLPKDILKFVSGMGGKLLLLAIKIASVRILPHSEPYADKVLLFCRQEVRFLGWLRRYNHGEVRRLVALLVRLKSACVMLTMSRVCKQCQTLKEAAAFHQQTRRCKTTCIACLNANARQRRAIRGSTEKQILAAKRCFLCKKEQPACNFAKNRTEPDGLATWCKSCYNQRSGKYKEQRRCTDVSTCLQCGMQKQMRDMSAENTAQCKACKQARKSRRWKMDATFRLQETCRNRLRCAMKRAQTSKSTKSVKLLGCTWGQLRHHLEKQFARGMCWENHGLRGWHIDHIRPCASFDLTDLGQQATCFHFLNLQPLWAKDNLKKGSSFVI